MVRRDGTEGSAQAPTGSTDPSEGDERGAVVFLGTSLTAGYGLDDPEAAYPARIQERIDRARLPFRVVNAGVSGETSAGGLSRLDWVLDEPLAVLVVELGANDGLRGLPPEALQANLTEIVERTRQRRPEADVVLLGMEAPPNLGSAYTDAFRQVFQTVAETHGVRLVPFLLEGVGGEARLNQADGIHPNAQGHGRLAETIWPTLEAVLRDRVGRQER